MIDTQGSSASFIFLIETGMKQYLKIFRNPNTFLRFVAKASPLAFLVLVSFFVSLKINNKTETQKKPTPPPTLSAARAITVDASPTPALSPTGIIYPSKILDLSNWKITLPIGSSEKPVEIKQPELFTYAIDPWFMVMPEDNGVRFRAPVNAVTTTGSSYPRSELREMTGKGMVKASWSSTSGTHTMFLDQAITSVPKKKKHVVAGQIHDANNDVIVIRLEYPNLYVNVNGKNKSKLDSAYVLGKRFTVKFMVSEGKTSVYYNNSATPAYTLNKKYSDAYFKTGAYTQSNCSKEGSLLCHDDNYGEVVVYDIRVLHQ